MSGKSAGKKRNRAAQSEQHGFQENPADIAGKNNDRAGDEHRGPGSEKQRASEKLRDLERRRRDREGHPED